MFEAFTRYRDLSAQYHDLADGYPPEWHSRLCRWIELPDGGAVDEYELARLGVL